ncbi:MAG TPA: type III pantothenate kinase [bacterium]|nr:type III pantothenate kinase [bacterium]
MFFCVDIGNTNTVVGIAEKGLITARWRIATDRDATFDDLAAKFHPLMTLAKVPREAVVKVIVSSVVPVWDHSWERFAREYFGKEALFVGAETPCGITLAVENPREVGADRIVNAVAAISRHPEGALVVDSGTAITIDVVAPDRSYRGGAIMPGMLVSLEALAARTAKLPRVHLDRPSHALGRTTAAGIQSGIYYGFAGMIDRVIEEILPELDFKPRIVATGGLAGGLAAVSRHIEEYDRDLTLRGLDIIASLN